jgi:hypothetical protein
MFNEEKISKHLANMEALAMTMLSEAAKGRRMLNKIEQKKSSEMAIHFQKRRASFYKRLKNDTHKNI